MQIPSFYFHVVNLYLYSPIKFKIGCKSNFQHDTTKKTWEGNILTIKPMKQTKIGKKKKKQ